MQSDTIYQLEGKVMSYWEEILKTEKLKQTPQHLKTPEGQLKPPAARIMIGSVAYRILIYLQERNPEWVPTTELKHITSDLQQLNSTLKRLERNNLVERQLRSHPSGSFLNYWRLKGGE